MGGTFSLILALVGILNFINAVVVSIVARRRELAMLQSVGMTGKQLRQMLFHEGLLYTALTALFTFTVGLGLVWLIVKVIAGQVWFFRQSITVMPSLFCMIPFFLVSVSVPLLSYRWLTRASLVERLRIE
jgi:putative ABC transport system permease protein